MKKVLFSMALMLGLLAFAPSSHAQDAKGALTPISSITQQELVYVEVTINDLTDTVRKVVESYQSEFTIMKLEFCSEKEYTKVTLKSKSDDNITVVVLDKNGSVI